MLRTLSALIAFEAASISRLCRIASKPLCIELTIVLWQIACRSLTCLTSWITIKDKTYGSYAI